LSDATCSVIVTGQGTETEMATPSGSGKQRWIMDLWRDSSTGSTYFPAAGQVFFLFYFPEIINMFST
jgi:hypothetical protein